MIPFMQHHRWTILPIMMAFYWIGMWFFTIPKVERFIVKFIEWVIFIIIFLLWFFFTSPENFHKKED